MQIMGKCFLLGALALSAALAAETAEMGSYSAGLLANMPKLKNFEAARESSYDPTGGNADGRHDWPVAPGETRTIAEIEGAGIITHIWMTVASYDERHYKNIVLRMYWDGEEHPSVEVPYGDFFGLGNNEYYQYTSLPIQIGNDRGMNCYWHMPFSNGAKITVTNDGPSNIAALYYYVDYQVHKSVPEDMGRFHAQYRQQYPASLNENYVLLEGKGRGHYVGCNLSVHLRAGWWWGEGDDMIYVDGDEHPTVHGTGAEDYFCGAWCYGDSGPKSFSNPYFGAPLIKGGHTRGALWNVYRYHLEDPIPFSESIRVTIESGHNNDRADDYSSVAYWYQTEPHAPFPPLPEPDERMFPEATAYTEEPYAGIVESERWAKLFQNENAVVQSMLDQGNLWSFGEQLLLRPQGPESFSAELPLFPTDAGTYPFDVYYTAGPDYGRCELLLNGEKLCAWDGYNAEGIVRKHLASPNPLVIKPDTNVLEIRVTGKHSEAGGYLAGMDCIRVKQGAPVTYDESPW